MQYKRYREEDRKKERIRYAAYITQAWQKDRHRQLFRRSKARRDLTASHLLPLSSFEQLSGVLLTWRHLGREASAASGVQE